jgi:Nup53/35/40-type RNA recognition motif
MQASPSQHLPNFLLSPNSVQNGSTPNAAHGASPTRGGESPAFNQRLRPANSARPLTSLEPPLPARSPSPFDRKPPPSPFAPGANAGTPGASGRKPPARSLLDAGPGVMSLQSASPDPSSAHARSSYAPMSLTTPPASPGGAVPAPGAERWITVFGFPAAMEGLVVRDFRRHGEVLRTLPGRGNWLHIMYRAPTQAHVALHRPWRMVGGGSTMVGVTACTEPEACAAAAEQHDSTAAAPVLVASPSPYTPRRDGDSPDPQQPVIMMGMPSPSAGLRTPKSVVRGGVNDNTRPSALSGGTPRTPASAMYATGVSPAGIYGSGNPSPGNPSSIMRTTPQHQRGLVSYITDWMSGA